MLKATLATAFKFGMLYAGAPFGLLVPRPVQRQIVAGLVHPFIQRMDGPREALAANFRAASGGRLSEAAIRRRVRAVFINYTFYLIDYMSLPFRNRDSILGLLGEVRGAEHVRAAREKGRGLLFVGPHVGNWELAGFLLRDLQVPIHALSIRDPHPALERFRSKFRDREGINIIFVGSDADAGGMLSIQSALARNEAVAMLGDRLYMGREYTAPFFGRNVRFPAGPLHIAAITGAPIVPFAAVREGERYSVVLSPPIDVPEPSPDGFEIAGNALAASFEAYVRGHPDQWYNFHPIFTDAPLTPYDW